MAQEIKQSESAANVAGIRFSLALLAGLALVVFLREAQAIVLPIFVAMFFSALAAPLVLWLEQKRVPTAIAVLTVVGGIALLGLLAAVLLATSMEQLTQRVPYYQHQLDSKLETILPTSADGEAIHWQELVRQINPGQAMSVAAGMLNGIRSILTQSMLIVLLMLFLLLDLGGFLKRLGLVSPSARAYLHDVAISLKHYFVIKTAISLCTGVAAGLWCYVLGVDFALLWGFLAFLLNYIPSIGSILAAIPAVALSFVQLSSGAALAVAAGYVLINVVLGNLIEPRVMGRGLGLSTFVVFVSLVVWGWVLGPVGMLLSVPLTMVIKIALEASPRTSRISLLMGSAVLPQTLEATPTLDGEKNVTTSEDL